MESVSSKEIGQGFTAGETAASADKTRGIGIDAEAKEKT